MRLGKYRGKFCVYLGQGKRKSLRTADPEIAARRFADFKKQATANIELVGDLVEKYLAENDTKASIRTMRLSWKAAKQSFAPLRPEHIDRQFCKDYAIKRRKQGVGNETIRKEIGIVRTGLRWSLPACPAVFALPPMPAPRERYLTREEYRRLLDACKPPHLRLFIMLALATAGRKSAILELTWDRVDFETGLIRLGMGDKRAKGRATVPMTQSLRAALLEAKEGALTDYVVEYGARRVLDIKTGFMSAARAASIKGVTPHDLRRTAAVWMAEAGVSMSEIAQYLGHTSTAITERVYARFSPNYLKKASDALEV
jgi:integrase